MTVPVTTPTILRRVCFRWICWRRMYAAVMRFCWKHARAAVAHPEHYAVAITITVALVVMKHFDVAAVWVLWLDKLLTSIAEG